jgi:hypothetical protein
MRDNDYTYIHKGRSYPMSDDMVFYTEISFSKLFTDTERRQAVIEYNKAIDINNAEIDSECPLLDS